MISSQSRRHPSKFFLKNSKNAHLDPRHQTTVPAASMWLPFFDELHDDVWSQRRVPLTKAQQGPTHPRHKWFPRSTPTFFSFEQKKTNGKIKREIFFPNLNLSASQGRVKVGRGQGPSPSVPVSLSHAKPRPLLCSPFKFLEAQRPWPLGPTHPHALATSGQKLHRYFPCFFTWRFRLPVL